MTTYIDSPALSTGQAPPAGIAITPMLLPFSDVAPGLFALWTLPLCGFQIWAHGWATLLGSHSPETDKAPLAEQLPVPNPLQAAKDRELFA